MINQIPFVQRTSQLCPRRGYSTALSARYDGWAGLYDEHGQHTIVLIEYDYIANLKFSLPPSMRHHSYALPQGGSR